MCRVREPKIKTHSFNIQQVVLMKEEYEERKGEAEEVLEKQERKAVTTHHVSVKHSASLLTHHVLWEIFLPFSRCVFTFTDKLNIHFYNTLLH